MRIASRRRASSSTSPVSKAQESQTQSAKIWLAAEPLPRRCSAHLHCQAALAALCLLPKFAREASICAWRGHSQDSQPRAARVAGLESAGWPMPCGPALAETAAASRGSRGASRTRQSAPGSTCAEVKTFQNMVLRLVPTARRFQK